MEKIIIEGGHRLAGTIQTAGAKNAALPIMMATILAPGEHRLTNVPELLDVSSTLSLLGRIGCPSLLGNVLRIDTTRLAFCEAPYDVVRKMRASVLVLGPLLARHGEARVSMPGGCAIGTRPIDQHLRGLEALGCEFTLERGYIHGTCDGLKGAEIHLDFPTVTGTENILMAAVLASGTTVLSNAAREPEVTDLVHFLESLGAKISGAGTSTLIIEGVPRLSPATRPYSIVSDRIEAGTYLCAAAITGGDITLENTDPALLTAVLSKLEEAGCEVTTTETTVRVQCDGRLKPITLNTRPYPGFPTDMQAQLMAILSTANGTSTIVENIFENRFMHIAELRRMGADIEYNGKTATVKGQAELTPAATMASDLRASAALVLAGLATSGLTEVLRIYHLDRGYERLVEKLEGVGARIARVSDSERDPVKLREALPVL